MTGPPPHFYLMGQLMELYLMASLHLQAGDRPGYKIRWRDEHGKNRAVWLGSVSESSAKDTFENVEELLRAQVDGDRVHKDTKKWVRELSGKLRATLARAGLVEPRRPVENGEADRLLDSYLERFVDRMVDANPRTKNNYSQTRTWLVAHLGADTPLATITVGEMNRWVRSLRAGKLALSNRNKHIQRAKKMFAEAVADRLIEVSPAEKLAYEKSVKGKRVDRSRQCLVDAALTKEVIKGLPAGDVRLTFVLARFLGLRRCEIYRLTWADVDWAGDRLRVDSIKTGERDCPLFEARPYLEAASKEGGRRIITHFQTEDSMTTLMRKYIVRVIGEDRMWPKTLQQLRSVRRTELEERFPNHVLNSWFGHDGKTAEDHYLQITPDHWQRATIFCQPNSPGGNDGGNLPGISDAFTAETQTENAGIPAVYGWAGLETLPLVPPSGVEPLFPD